MNNSKPYLLSYSINEVPFTKYFASFDSAVNFISKSIKENHCHTPSSINYTLDYVFSDGYGEPVTNLRCHLSF